MVVTLLKGKIFLTLRGPETKATTADCPAEGEWLGIRFKLGAFMPQLAPGHLLDRPGACPLWRRPAGLIEGSGAWLRYGRRN